ncbi:hypothetical protein [Kitasatospora sp. NPDC094015]|uniref:hypothetical protein n=1 Tax=Kitasatospora sp. NPDC094015 TaxID=3155205 RepID=UPI003325443F
MRTPKPLVVPLVLGCAVACFAWIWVVTGAMTGCSLRDAYLADELADDPVLDVARPGSVRVDEAFHGCDEDDGFAYAGRTYDHPGGREDLVAFFRTAVTEAGWQSEPSERPGGPSCFTSRRGDLTVHLALSFPDLYNVPGEQESPPSRYTVELRASHDGSAWC